MLYLSQTSSLFRADMTVGILRKRLVVKKVSSLRPGGDFVYERGGDARRLAEGSKFRILVVRGAGTRNEPLRTSAWQAIRRGGLQFLIRL